MFGCHQFLQHTSKIGKPEKSTTTTIYRESSTPRRSFKLNQGLWKSKPRSYIQILRKSKAEPIIVTISHPYEIAGLHELREWNATQNAFQLLLLSVAGVPIPKRKVDRAVSRKVHRRQSGYFRFRIKLRSPQTQHARFTWKAGPTILVANRKDLIRRVQKTRGGTKRIARVLGQRTRKAKADCLRMRKL